MQEAFGQAVLRSDRAGKQLTLGTSTTRLLRVRTGAELRPAGHAQRADDGKTVYAARVLARRWCTVVKSGGSRDRELHELRDRWLVVRAELDQMTVAQQTEVFSEVACEVQTQFGWNGKPFTRYWQDAKWRYPERFEGLDHIPGLHPLSAAALLIHAVEELADSPDWERRRLHALLHDRSPERDDRSLWIIWAIAAWACARDERLAHAVARTEHLEGSQVPSQG